MSLRYLVGAALCLSMVLLAGCGVRGAVPESPTPSGTTTGPAALGSPDNFGPPFTGWGIETTTLAAEMARFDEPPSLPAPEVAGVSDGAYAGMRKRPQGIWVHYPTGIYLSIQREPRPFDARDSFARAQDGGFRHPDSPAYLLETIGGRDTFVVTEGPLVDREGNRPSHAHDTRTVLVWTQDGWNYTMAPNGPRPASLDLLRAAAASIR